MNYIDIILIVPIIWAVYRGFRDGVIVQLGGIVGIVFGLWMAYKFGTDVAQLLSIPKEYAKAGGFIVVLTAVIVAVWVLGRALRSMAKAIGLGMFDKIGGVVLALIKVILACGVAIMLFEMGNEKYGWADKKTLNASILYTPVNEAARVAFPYLDNMKQKYFDKDNNLLNNSSTK